MQFKIKLLTLTLLASISTSLLANKYKIEIEAKDYKNKSAELLKYIDSKMYVVDSLTIDKKGHVSFQDTTNLATSGEYVLRLNKDTDFTLLIDTDTTPVDMEIKISSDFTNSIVTGSKDTELLWKYIQELTSILQNPKSYQKDVNTKTSSEEISNDESLEITRKYIDGYPNTWFSSYIKAYTPVEINEFITEGMTLQEAQEQYKKHILDNINFEDARLWNTSFYSKFLDDYLTNIVYQTPDSIAQSASNLVERTKSNDAAFIKMLSYLVNKSQASNVVGDENVWAKLFENYILDKELSWIQPNQYHALNNEYQTIKLNRIGMTASDLFVNKLDGSKMNINDIEADFTILLFYSSSCGHCGSAISDLHSFLDKNKDESIKVIAFILDNNEEGWKSYVEQHKMQNWINVSDFNFESEYWAKYDTRATPMIYLLDKDKRILSKKISVETLSMLLERIK